MAEAARFENAPAHETMGRDMFSPVEIQSLINESEQMKQSLKHDQPR
jgi:hypothetical protein